MSSESVYDKVPKRTGQYVKWTDVGQRVVGDLVAVGIGRDFNDDAVPEWTIEQDNGGGEVRVTCGQANLHKQAMEKRPAAGDHIAITYTHDERVPKGSVKVFTVDVVPGGASRKAASADEFS